MHNPRELNRISKVIFDSALEVHRYFGPGLLVSIYEASLKIELELRETRVKRMVRLPLEYKDYPLPDPLRIDLFVEEKIVIKVKAVESILPIHEAQIISQLKLTNCRLGFLINFNAALLKEGFRRFVLNF